MSASPPSHPLSVAGSSGVVAVLPFLYVAWADGLLTPAEVEALRGRVERLGWLDEAERRRLAAWLDPARPPSASTYFGWVRALRQAARRIPDAERKTLAELGVALAGLAAADGDGPAPEAARALGELEDALGIVGREAVRDLVGRTLPPSDAGGDGAPAAPEALDVGALQALLDGPHRPLRDRVRALLSQDAFRRPDPHITDDDYRDLVMDWTRRLADAGLGALAFPAYAGGEHDIAAFIAAFETIAYHDLDLAIKFGVQFGLFGGSINQLGNEAQRRRYLPDVATLALPGCFAMTERRHGSNVRDLRTTATLDRAAGEWVIETPDPRDHKEWIGNAARHGRMATVFAQLVIDGEGFGVHAFLVPIRDDAGRVMPGVRIEDSGHKMGLNGVDNGRLWFTGVRVPREALLARFAQVDAEGTYTSAIPSASKRFFVMLGTLVGGRIAVASGANAAAQCGLEIAVRYGARRRQFGRAGEDEVVILDYLSHQRRLLPLVATSYGLAFALHDLADRFAGLPPDADTREVEGEAAALKAMASWHGTRALQEAREACGGEGFRWTSRIASRKADSDIFTTFEGDNTVLQLQVAKGLLAGYRQEFESLDAWGLLHYVRDLADVRFGELNPLARRQTGTAHLRDPDWHADLFERRERQLLVTAAQRLKYRMDDSDVDSFDAFVEVQDHLLTLAAAHAERLVHERFRAAVERLPAGAERDLLQQLCILFALTHIEAARGWYLEEGLFEGSVSKAIRTEVNALLGRLRPRALALVEAWGIPPELLASDLLAEQA